MKTLGRTLIILVAALVVVAATMAFGQTPSAAALLAQPGRPMLEGSEGRVAPGTLPTTGDTATATTAAPTQPPMRRGEARPGAGGTAGLMGWLGIGKNLGLIAALVVAVELATRVGRRVLPRRRTQQLSAAE